MFAKTENIYSVEYKKSYIAMLWNQTQNLPPEAFKRLEEKYREAGFFIEVRLQLPDFVESNFMPRFIWINLTRLTLSAPDYPLDKRT